MEYRTLSNTSLEVSRIGIGCWAIGGHGWGRVNDDDSIRAIQTALESGINFFDTADVYGLGHSESILSKALDKNRSNAVISTKFGLTWDTNGNIKRDTTPQRVNEAVEASLRRLNIESIPLYIIHYHDGVTPIEETLYALLKCKEAGKIQHIGCSNLPIPMMETINQLMPLSGVQVPYNAIDRKMETTFMPVLNNLSISTLTYSSLAQGLLSGKYSNKVEFDSQDIRSRSPYFQSMDYAANKKIIQEIGLMAKKYQVTTTQMALRWILDNPLSITSALTGVKNHLQVKENIGALDWNLEKEDFGKLKPENAEI